MSEYSISCGCGRPHQVAATQAGSVLRCSCGNIVAVPNLSALRVSVGESPIPLSTVERIDKMIRDGELPSGAFCPLSGRRADHTMRFRIQCESAWVRGGESPAAAIAYVLILGWIGALIAMRRSQPSEEHGRETYIIVPVAVSSEAYPKIMRIRRQKSLKALLAETPIYSQLLKDYPNATVSVIER